MQRGTCNELSQQTLALVMAGGAGSRLKELTRAQCKPALPIGGHYRNVDFPLSNCLNSGIRHIALMTQYKAHSLIRHIQYGWSFLRPEAGEFVELWPAQQQVGEAWYAGTADALYQNIDLIAHHGPKFVLVLAGDHVYKMNYLEMIQQHVEKGAAATVACIEVDANEANAFGILATDGDGWVRRFDEKPANPAAVPHDRDAALASMGIYVFDREELIQALIDDAAVADSSHDFGKDIFPRLIDRRNVLAHSFLDPHTGMEGYWRDVGTVDSYWRANMELLAEPPRLDLYDDNWPITTYHPQHPPPLFFGQGMAERSIVSNGCQIGGRVRQSLVSPNCRIESGARVESSVVFPNVTIGRNCRVRRTIVDDGCHLPDNTVIGEDLLDEANSYWASPNGITVVTADRHGAADVKSGRHAA